jgi:hypothetical protein
LTIEYCGDGFGLGRVAERVGWGIKADIVIFMVSKPVGAENENLSFGFSRK